MKTQKNTTLSYSDRSTMFSSILKSNIVPKQYISTTEICDHSIVKSELNSYTTITIPPTQVIK
jgi:hypothetical protein